MIAANAVSLAFDAGGTTDPTAPTLVLLHGLWSNAAIWQRLLPLIGRDWDGRWIAPDLRGHGRSPWATGYAVGDHAADLADLLTPASSVTLLAHSMGGVVAFALAAGRTLPVARVFAFGVKLDWTSTQLDDAARRAAEPPRYVESADRAAERAAAFAGLKGLASPDEPVIRRGWTEDQTGFRLTTDPAAQAIGAGGARDNLAALSAPVRLAVGDADPLVSVEETRAADPTASILAGAGHNPHWTHPERLWDAFRADQP